VSPTELSHHRLHPLGSIIFTLVLSAVAFQFIGPFIGFFVAAPFYPAPMTEMIQHLATPYDYPALKTTLLIMQGIGAIFGLIIVPALFIKKSQNLSVNVFFQRPFYLTGAIMVVCIVLTFLVVDSPIATWNESLKFPEWMSSFEEWARRWEDDLRKLTQYVTKFDSIGALILGFVVIAIIPAIGEEFVFRGIIQRDVLRGTGNVHLAIWLTAIIFSAFHIQFFGFFPRMLLGALFGYLYHWSGSLIMPMLAHFLNNGMIVIALYLYQQGHINVDLEKPEAASWQAVLMSVFVLGVLLYLFKKFYEQRPLPPAAEKGNLPDSFD
jgi:membrane protease YdiL (CAAX protease family)